MQKIQARSPQAHLLSNVESTTTQPFDSEDVDKKDISLSKNDRRILIFLIEYMEREGHGCISLSSITKQTQIQKTTICTRINAMVANGILKKNKEVSNFSQANLTNCYEIIHIEKIKTLLQYSQQK